MNIAATVGDLPEVEDKRCGKRIAKIKGLLPFHNNKVLAPRIEIVFERIELDFQ
jgi:hypothetical protein